MAFDFGDWGSWGIGDWYDGHEEELKTAIESGQPFDTGWHGWKKTEYSMRIYRRESDIVVQVHSSMDSALEQLDLFCDFLTEEEQNHLTDDTVEAIRDALCMGDFVEEVDDDQLLSDVGFEEVMMVAEELLSYCDYRLNESFRECIGTTLAVLYGMSDTTMTLIAERIRKYCPEEEGEE